MNFAKLTDYQLYEIIQNLSLDKELRDLANREFNSRNLSIDHVREIVSRHETAFKPAKGEKLIFEYKILLILFPFLIPIQSAFAGKWLAKGEKRKWKDYWLYLSLGYLFWTILTIVFARYVLFNHRA